MKLYKIFGFVSGLVLVGTPLAIGYLPFPYAWAVAIFIFYLNLNTSVGLMNLREKSKLTTGELTALLHLVRAYSHPVSERVNALQDKLERLLKEQ